MWPPYEASNFEARFDARISKLFDIVASNSIVFCICVIIFIIFMNTIVRMFDCSIASVQKKFLKIVRLFDWKQTYIKSFVKKKKMKLLENIPFSTTKVVQILKIKEGSCSLGMMFMCFFQSTICFLFKCLSAHTYVSCVCKCELLASASASLQN